MVGDSRRNSSVKPSNLSKGKRKGPQEDPGVLYDCRRFAEVVSLFPNLDESIPAESVLYLTRSLEALGKRRQALDCLLDFGLEKVHQGDLSMYVEALCDAGRILYELKKYGKAREFYRLAEKKARNDWEPKFRLGLISYEEGDYLTAFKYFKRSRFLDRPLLASIAQNLTWKAPGNDKQPVCRDYAEARIRQDYVDSVLIEHYLKRCLHPDQAYDPDVHVATLLRKLTLRASGDSNILAFVGHIWCEIGNRERGMKILRCVLREEPTHPFANLSVALYLNESGSSPDAVYRHLLVSLVSVRWGYWDFESEVGIGTYYHGVPSRYALDAHYIWMDLTKPQRPIIDRECRRDQVAMWQGFIALRKKVLKGESIVLRKSGTFG